MTQSETILRLKAELEKARLEAAEASRQRDVALLKLKDYKEKIEKAEKASKMKSLFLANMSHEIRTPLNAIEGFSRVIAETDSAEERMKFLEIVESNNSRLLALINEILDLSRVESGEITMKLTLSNLNEICDNIKQIFKFRCPDNLYFKAEKPSKAVLLKTDPNRLTQVYCNLISNALKHTQNGGITYGYKVDETNNQVVFYVSDTGSGIAPEDLETIFHTYVSKDAETKNGFGLGLPLSKIIVEKLGGKIGVRSTLGKGSTFTFVLPFEGTFATTETTKTNPIITRTLRTAPIGDASKLKLILVAEDEECNYELVKNVLANRYRLIRARNGVEAVTMNEDENPDLILMDIRMPDMDGIDATRIIKEVNPNVPVIALSAYALEDSIKMAKDAGCDDFIAKPFKVEEFLATLERYTYKK
ncbi:MAG: response regulator [Prevotella sp.]|nr:response regulator [Prevotella sp.]MDD5896455.1 response regulator [Prevotellaceae bacterium]